MCQDVTGNAAAGNKGGDLPAQALTHVIDNRFMALHPQLPSNRKTGGAAADHGNFMARSRGRRWGLSLQAGLPQDSRIDRRQMEGLARAVLHAEVRAEVTANNRR